MPDRIVITKAAIGSRFIVSFEPRTVSWPSLEFRNHREAKSCAEARQAAHSWQIIDQTAEGGA
ncbi:hypothetical protein [Sphingobium chlorophenolicum]|uniref:Uncharacterized protein n=1 Tax=Sphingobium chlorophenolicum TaxID=46429 RepID=A0A081RCZ4_SPHCR|nr:hypothetical protein [Sphingobium chlorophenolicum]KEQ53067.1 hypothetical protein BV95_02723 [Sphingobium chlorophenolicum]